MFWDHERNDPDIPLKSDRRQEFKTLFSEHNDRKSSPEFRWLLFDRFGCYFGLKG